MIYEIVLIPDDYFSKQGEFWVIGKKKKIPFISISPAQNENYANIGWWKLKIAAEEAGRQVRAYTHINMLPLAYPMADTLFLTKDEAYVRKMYQNSSRDFIQDFIFDNQLTICFGNLTCLRKLSCANSEKTL
jgi:hypothetical protein